MHASSSGSWKENELVHPLFGGIERRFDLVASIYVLDRHRRRKMKAPLDGNSTSTTGGNATSTLSSRGSSIRLISESGSSSNGRQRERPAFERVWSEVVMRDLDVKTSYRQVVADAVLPGSAM